MKSLIQELWQQQD